MKVAAMLGNQKGGLAEKPDPKAKGDFVVVKVQSVPMCTEYKGFKSGGKGDCLGHEAAGEIVEVDRSSRVKVGDRVVVQPVTSCGRCHLCLRGENIHCQNMRNMHEETGTEAGGATFAQDLEKPDYHMSLIPDDITTEHAGLACCGVGPTFGAMEQMGVNAIDTIMITGMGPVGLGGVINATYRGARTIAVESHPFRANLAKELGATLVLDPNDDDNIGKIMDFTDGVGVDKAVDCSGAAPAQRFLIDAARRKGQVTFVGEGGAVDVHVSSDMIRKGLVLRGNWHYNLAEYPRLLNVIRNNSEKIEKFITHCFPMSDVQSAWELQTTGNCGKVLLDPWS
jgi:L-iditol 2-dehydrogenase